MASSWVEKTSWELIERRMLKLGGPTLFRARSPVFDSLAFLGMIKFIKQRGKFSTMRRIKGCYGSWDYDVLWTGFHYIILYTVKRYHVKSFSFIIWDLANNHWVLSSTLWPINSDGSMTFSIWWTAWSTRYLSCIGILKTTIQSLLLKHLCYWSLTA